MYMMELDFFQVNKILFYKIFVFGKNHHELFFWVKFVTFCNGFYMNIMITTCIKIVI